MRVVMPRPSRGLQYDDVSDVESILGTGIENIFEAGMSCSHERTEPFGVAKEPETKKLRHRQHHMAIGYTRHQPSSDEVGPSVGINLGTGKTEAGLAGEGNAADFSTGAASVLNKAHLFRIAAVEHFLNGVVVVGMVKLWMGLLKRIPVIVENPLERVFVNAFHGCSLRTTITEMAKRVERRVENGLC